MVRKLTSFLVEIGRGNERSRDGDGSARSGEPWQPTAPPSGLFLEAIVYRRRNIRPAAGADRAVHSPAETR